MIRNWREVGQVTDSNRPDNDARSVRLYLTFRPYRDIILRVAHSTPQALSLMNVLITSANSRTAGIVRQQLAAAGHYLRLTDVDDGPGVEQCDLGHGSETDAILASMDAIVHIGYDGYTSDDANDMIDYHTRRTYNLLWAAAELPGSPPVINISTLKLMSAYEENLVVTENWKPLPHAGDVAMLSAHLCEIVCKEFARDRMLPVLNLRLGWPITEGGRDSAAASGSDSAVSAHDVGAAIDAALSARLPQWQTVHVQSPVARQRYRTDAAVHTLGINI